jgi:hypothetical protein
VISRLDGRYLIRIKTIKYSRFIYILFYSKSSFTKLSYGSEMIRNAIGHILWKKMLIKYVIAPLTSGNRQCTSLAVGCQVYNHTASKLCPAVNKIFSKISLKNIREMALHAWGSTGVCPWWWRRGKSGQRSLSFRRQGESRRKWFPEIYIPEIIYYTYKKNFTSVPLKKDQKKDSTAIAPYLQTHATSKSWN